MVLGRISRNNSNGWPAQHRDADNFDDLYETLPSQYRHSVTSASFADAENRRSSCSDLSVVQHQNQVEIL
jgi:hypothetical protein